MTQGWLGMLQGPLPPRTLEHWNEHLTVPHLAWSSDGLLELNPPHDPSIAASTSFRSIAQALSIYHASNPGCHCSAVVVEL